MRPSPEPRVAEFLDRIAAAGIGLASITVWEILNGIGRLDPGQRRDELAERFEGILDDFFEDRVLDWTLADAKACAHIMEARRREGEPLDDHLPDAMIAAAAAARGLGVVTRDVGGFRNTGIHAVNPWNANDVMPGERGT